MRRNIPDVFCSVGTHPHNAQDEPDIDAEALMAIAKHPKVVAIGEAGLDYHYDKSPREQQAKSLRQHIAAARETGLPLVIHSRDCDADMAAILTEETGKGAFPAVLHCFTGGRDLAMRAIDLGLHISFTGILTFKRSDDLRAIAKDLPAERILVETDAPYLAPLPYRGKRNEPAYVVETAKVLAETRGVSPDEIARQTTENFFRLFSKVPRDVWPTPHEPDLHHPRLRLVHGRAARGAGLGRLRSQQSEEPPPPLLALGRTRAMRKATARAFWSTARPICATQLLDAEVDWLDGVLITHEHADHTHGIDDLRPLFVHKRRRVDVYLDEPTSRDLHARFGYCFAQAPGSDYPPILTERRLVPGETVAIDGQGGPIEALPVLQEHGDIPSLGFRFGNVAYSADIKALPPASIAAMAGLDVWIVDALRRTPHPSHFNLDEALDWIARVKPKRAILTNLHSDLDYETLRDAACRPMWSPPMTACVLRPTEALLASSRCGRAKVNGGTHGAFGNLRYLGLYRNIP